MTQEELAGRLIAIQDTLYRVSFSLLPSRYDREDAVQEAVGTALEKIGTLREEKFFNTWMIRILINECRALLRKKRREMPAEEIPPPLPPDSDHEVLDALLQLDPKLRLPLVLYYVEGYSVREIAHMVRAPESTVKTRMARGRALAKDMLLEDRKGGHFCEQAQ